MRIRIILLGIFIFLFGSGHIFAQYYEVTIDQEVVRDSPADRIFISVYIRALDASPVILGKSRFAMDVSYEHIVEKAPIQEVDGLWDDTNDPDNYKQQKAHLDKKDKWISIDINPKKKKKKKDDGNSGVEIPTTTTLVGTISMELKDNPSALSGIEWHTSELSITDENGTDITSFGTFTSPTLFPMPVELTLFTGVFENEGITLRWHTATEVNNYGFEIERNISDDPAMGVWETINFVTGYGNSNSPKEYSYTDNNISSSGVYHYRLRQIDFDGTFEYSPKVEVDVEVSHKFVLHQNYPNPFNPTTKISFELPIETKVQVTIYNIIGEVVEVLADDIYSHGSHELVFNGERLAAGIYCYSLQAGNQRLMGKMLLLK